jgi:integrase
MTRRVERLSSAKVKHAKVGLHPDGGGLYLQVTASKDGSLNKSWVFRFARDGRERRMGLGSLSTFGLGEARDKAAECRKRLDADEDPIEARNAERSQRVSPSVSMTFERCAIAYMAAHEASWRSAKHHQQWQQSLRTHVYPVIGGTVVDQIDLNKVLAVLTPIWTAKPETASRIRSRIELVLDWAKVRGYRDGDNPARWRGHLKHLLPSTTKVKAKEHYAAMPYEALPVFLSELRKVESVAARALEFLILTAARTGEVRGARWDEIDLDGKVWSIPGPRMKGGQPHRVPLSQRALDIVDWAHGLDHTLVFPGIEGEPLHTQMLPRSAQALGANVTVHGFRSTFKDWCAECTSTPDWVSEKALAHIVGDETRRAYQRGDLFNKRRTLMDDWAKFCASQVAGSNVVSLKMAKTRP